MIDDTLKLFRISNGQGKKKGPVQGYNLPRIASNWSYVLGRCTPPPTL